MKTQNQGQHNLTTPQPATASSSIRRTAGRTAGRSIVSSVTFGAVLAMVLTLVVFPGGTEATTTGTILLAFAAGWALLVALTGRRTTQPQRWAVVPAVAMGVAGAALVLSQPGDEAMAALTWVWPPLMLALVVWMSVQVRRSVNGNARWMLASAVAVLGLSAIGGLYGNVVTVRDQHAFAAPGKLYQVGGHRLHLDCQGSGSPTVVLSGGLGETSAGWARIARPLAATTRVCAYDRAGQGWSDEALSPRDGIESAADLHSLLAKAGEHGPFVLVGHSTGGTYAMTYAAQYPGQVAGMVLLDSSSPEQFTRMPAYRGQYRMMLRPMYGLLQTLSRVGLGHLVPGASHLPPADAAKVNALASTTKSFRNHRDEVAVIPQVFAQAQALTTLGDRPLAVLTASASSTNTVGWVDAQDALATLSTDSIHRTVTSTHTGLLEDVRPSSASLHAIVEVVFSARTGTPLPTR